MGGVSTSPRLLGLLFRLPQIFPLLSANRAVVGQAGKSRKAALYEITPYVHGYPQLTSKSDKNRCQSLDRPAIARGDRVHGRDDDSTHRASLSSVALDTLQSPFETRMSRSRSVR